MNYTTIISTSSLSDQLSNPSWVIFDCRHDLANPDAGRAAYLESHIPGARFAHLDQDLSGTITGKNGRHPLPSPTTFSEKLGKWGVDNTKQVIAYDAAGGMYASRLWWMLRWLGHACVCVLDGGWQKWLTENRQVTNEIPKIFPTTFIGSAHDMTVDAHYVEIHLMNPETRIIDARSPERYRGIGETLDRAGGHIPGAFNRFFKDNLDEDNCFKPPQELKSEFLQVIGETKIENIINQCGSGVTACHNLLALEIAGMTGAKLYPGSWSEWCSDSSRPIET